MNIGIFPGSFNPVHIGHLVVANYMAEFAGLDEVWFLITPKSPHKQAAELTDHELRFQLLQKAIGNYPKFKINTLEWEMTKPTYTVNTLQKLRLTIPENTYSLIIGADSWDNIHRWKDYQILLKNFKTLIYPRPGGNKSTFYHPNAQTVKNAPESGVSSSFIRKALREGKDVRFLLPEGIYEILIEQNVFCVPTNTEIITPETPPKE
ncbi:MAG: nicotinate-nucleotide adenylyltransferase [Dysgonamonadaceae bacterium]|jgi:nicotinate-nucleotide adenylyltransferase|nr:nicotinate-nucleotide adenylyltransferase [Dysgonamonadaceae bacterium]